MERRSAWQTTHLQRPQEFVVVQIFGGYVYYVLGGKNDGLERDACRGTSFRTPELNNCGMNIHRFNSWRLLGAQRDGRACVLRRKRKKRFWEDTDGVLGMPVCNANWLTFFEDGELTRSNQLYETLMREITRALVFF